MKKNSRMGMRLCLLLGIGIAQIGLASDSLRKTEIIKQIRPNNLKEAFLSAVQQSEVIGIQKELQNQSEELEAQARGALLPNVGGAATFLQQATPNNVTGNTIYPSSQSTVKVTATQPLFRGFRDFAALRQKKDLSSAQTLALMNSARVLFNDVSNAYFNFLILEQEERNYQIELEVHRKRLKELEGFFKIGRSQLTDLLTVKASIASLEAQLENTRGQVENSKDILAYFTGWNRNFILVDDETPLVSPSDIRFYLSKIEGRPDVQTALANVKAYEEGIPIARGAHLPSLDLNGNYYLTRPGVLSGANWDIQLALTVPLFQGGIIQSQIRQANSIARQYSLILSQTRRQAEQEIRTIYNSLRADTLQLGKLTELLKISKNNFETQSKYYRNGLVTNLDVLQSLNTYQEAKRQRDHQSFVVKLDTVKLEAATGQRREIDLNLKSKN